MEKKLKWLAVRDVKIDTSNLPKSKFTVVLHVLDRSVKFIYNKKLKIKMK